MSVQPIQQLPTALPAFEGAQVQDVALVISGRYAVDAYSDILVSVDDRVRIIGEYRCIAVYHKANKNGEMVREQVLRPIEGAIQIVPWDINDPTDNGIIRARPGSHP